MTRYFISTKIVKANLAAYGGTADGEYVDPVIQEENLRTSKIDLHLGHGQACSVERFCYPGSDDSGSGVGRLPYQFDRREPRRLAIPGFRAEHVGDL